jgi:hypothetical protein
MNRFQVYWSRVSPALLAVWPAPVNADACFEAAGFTDFADGGDEWDDEAEAFVERLVRELSAFGPPSLRAAPMRPERTWRERVLRRSAATPSLEAQIVAPMRWDSLPDAVVEFGASVSLRAGSGHFLVRITLPPGEVEAFADVALARAAAGHPLLRRDLAWEHLLPGDLRS